MRAPYLVLLFVILVLASIVLFVGYIFDLAGSTLLDCYDTVYHHAYPRYVYPPRVPVDAGRSTSTPRDARSHETNYQNFLVFALIVIRELVAAVSRARENNRVLTFSFLTEGFTVADKPPCSHPGCNSTHVKVRWNSAGQAFENTFVFDPFINTPRHELAQQRFVYRPREEDHPPWINAHDDQGCRLRDIYRRRLPPRFASGVFQIDLEGDLLREFRLREGLRATLLADTELPTDQLRTQLIINELIMSQNSRSPSFISTSSCGNGWPDEKASYSSSCDDTVSSLLPPQP